MFTDGVTQGKYRLRNTLHCTTKLENSPSRWRESNIIRIYSNLDHIPVNGGAVHVDFLVYPVNNLLLRLPLQLLLLLPRGVRHLLIPPFLGLPPDLISLESGVVCFCYWYALLCQPTLAFSLCWISRDISFLCLQTRFLF